MQDDIDTVLVGLDDEVAVVKRDGQERGLYEIGASVIADDDTRSGWAEGQISVCRVQLSYWLSLAATDLCLVPIIDLPPCLLWKSFGTSSHWETLKDDADLGPLLAQVRDTLSPDEQSEIILLSDIKLQ
jgi:hypothetical protein